MKPPVQSKVSRMKSSPGFTQQAIGMSGCQRLWIFALSSVQNGQFRTPRHIIRLMVR